MSPAWSRSPGAAGIGRVVLVAHSFDIPRATAEFAAEGIETIAAPTGIPAEGAPSWSDFVPSVRALQESYYALYELLGNAARVDIDAGRTHATGRRRDAGRAIEALCQEPGDRRFADAARAGEQIGMVQAAALQRIGQRPHHVILPYQVGKFLRPPFAGERLIAHRAFSVSLSKALRNFASHSVPG